jgi:hypothetical protein
MVQCGLNTIPVPVDKSYQDILSHCLQLHSFEETSGNRSVVVCFLSKGKNRGLELKVSQRAIFEIVQKLNGHTLTHTH